MPPLAVASSATDVLMTASVLARLISRFLWRDDEEADGFDEAFTFSALALAFSGAVPVVAARTAPAFADVCSEVPRCDGEDLSEPKSSRRTPCQRRCGESYIFFFLFFIWGIQRNPTGI